MNQNPLLQPLNCIVLFSGCSMPWNLLTSMICLSIFWGRLSYSLADFNSQENRASWLFKFSATVVGIAVAAYAWRCSKRRLGNLHEVDGADDSELTCFCGLPAKLRISRTSKNPYRLFYSCPKNAYFHQCEFFRWSDEIPTDSERHLEEKSFLRDECIHLQEKVELILSQRQQERIDWDRKEEELRSQLTAVQSELDDINKRIQEVNESEEMPPVDESYHVDDELDGAVVLGTV